MVLTQKVKEYRQEKEDQFFPQENYGWGYPPTPSRTPVRSSRWAMYPPTQTGYVQDVEYQSALSQAVVEACEWGIKFSGRPFEDAGQFFEDFIAECDNRGIKDEDKFKILFEVLQGAALWWYRCEDISNMSWRKFECEFLDIFVGGRAGVALQQKIRRRQQQMKEQAFEGTAASRVKYRRLPKRSYEEVSSEESFTAEPSLNKGLVSPGVGDGHEDIDEAYGRDDVRGGPGNGEGSGYIRQGKVDHGRSKVNVSRGNGGKGYVCQGKVEVSRAEVIGGYVRRGIVDDGEGKVNVSRGDGSGDDVSHGQANDGQSKVDVSRGNVCGGLVSQSKVKVSRVNVSGGSASQGKVNIGQGNVSGGYVSEGKVDDGQGKVDVSGGFGDFGGDYESVSQGVGEVNQGGGKVSGDIAKVSQGDGKVCRDISKVGPGVGEVSQGVGKVSEEVGRVSHGNGRVNRGSSNVGKGHVSKGKGIVTQNSDYVCQGTVSQVQSGEGGDVCQGRVSEGEDSGICKSLGNVGQSLGNVGNGKGKGQGQDIVTQDSNVIRPSTVGQAESRESGGGCQGPVVQNPVAGIGQVNHASSSQSSNVENWLGRVKLSTEIHDEGGSPSQQLEDEVLPTPQSPLVVQNDMMPPKLSENIKKLSGLHYPSLSNKNKRQMYVNCHVDEKCFKALVDSGADYSFIGSTGTRIAEELALPIFSAGGAQVLVANGVGICEDSGQNSVIGGSQDDRCLAGDNEENLSVKVKNNLKLPARPENRNRQVKNNGKFSNVLEFSPQQLEEIILPIPRSVSSSQRMLSHSQEKNSAFSEAQHLSLVVVPKMAGIGEPRVDFTPALGFKMCGAKKQWSLEGSSNVYSVSDGGPGPKAPEKREKITNLYLSQVIENKDQSSQALLEKAQLEETQLGKAQLAQAQPREISLSEALSSYFRMNKALSSNFCPSKAQSGNFWSGKAQLAKAQPTKAHLSLVPDMLLRVNWGNGDFPRGTEDRDEYLELLLMVLDEKINIDEYGAKVKNVRGNPQSFLTLRHEEDRLFIFEPMPP